MKLLIVDRESKNAVAGMACVFVAALLLTHSASPAPRPSESKHPFLPADAVAATPGRLDPAVLNTAREAAPPAAHVAPSRAAPFFYKGSGSDREHALDCLAAAAWYEAGNDPEGQKSVIQVVLNRVRHPSFPSSVCGVVFQGSELPTGCQFTFTCDGSLERRFPSAMAWKAAIRVSGQALDGAVDAAVGQATHYHADYVVPWWSGALQRVSQIGAHIFYRWPGGRGQLVGKRNWGDETDALASARMAELNPSSPMPAPDDTPDPAEASFVSPVAVAAVAPAAGRAHLVAVDPQSPNGRWAIAALDQCIGQTSCVVAGYAGGADYVRNINRAPAEIERPLFLYVRDASSRMELVLWDCDRTERQQAAQCMPKDRAAVMRLMHDR